MAGHLDADGFEIPAFRTSYRESGAALFEIDIEQLFQDWMEEMLGVKRAREIHEAGMDYSSGKWTARVPGVDESNFGRLTEAEIEMIEQLSYGYKGNEVAIRLGKSRETIKYQMKTAVHKMKAKNGTHLITLAIRSGQVLSQQKKQRKK